MKAKKLTNSLLLILSGVLVYYLTKEILEGVNFVIGFILMYGVYNKREIQNNSIWVLSLSLILIPLVYFLPPGLIWALLTVLVLPLVLIFIINNTNDDPNFKPIYKSLILAISIFMISLSEQLISYQINEVIDNSHPGIALAFGGTSGLLVLIKVHRYRLI
jgi:E3 ubiquitin-protein ligase DOA10